MENDANNNKELWIQLAGQEGAARGPFTVAPGDNVRDVMVTAGLEGWTLRGPGNVSLRPEDVLYDRIADQQKLSAVDISGLGAGEV